MSGYVGVAEAKRRFSELLDRVGAGEHIVIARHGKAAVVLVPPTRTPPASSRPAPTGFAALAGALADWDGIDDLVGDIYAARREAEDRPAPSID